MSGKGFGAGFGLLLALGAGALLLWNESRSVSVADSLWLGERAVKIVPADRVDPANEGRLVFVRGPARAAAPIVDPDTGATLRALYATRKVEMFQWREQSTSRRGNADPASVTLNPAWSERAEPTTVTMQARRLEN
ncbi:MAG: hypothetical protein JNK46_09330, partial [Methylobacteriaceae bacterium]|nr:hypothetical protein [Methylobacteriaceae bacterium]